MDSKHCPYCNSPVNSSLVSRLDVSKTGSVYSSHFMPLYSPIGSGSPQPPRDGYSLFHYNCPDCGKLSIRFKGKEDPFHGEERMIMPRSTAPIYPDYVPAAVRQDFSEAYETVEISPKASATLSRRCLQGMIRDVFGVSERTLYKEISAIQPRVSPLEWSAIDSLRKIGNIGAHMEADINTIIDVDPNEAETLVLFIEHLIHEWYIKRHADEELMRKITQINSNKQQQRNQPN